MSVQQSWLDFLQQTTKLTSDFIGTMLDAAKGVGSGSAPTVVTLTASASTNANSGPQNNDPVASPRLTPGTTDLLGVLSSSAGDTIPTAVVRADKVDAGQVAISVQGLLAAGAQAGEYSGTLVHTTLNEVIGTIR